MKDLFDSAYWLVHTGERCVLAMIRKSSGSTPRGQGAGMLVLEDGSMRVRAKVMQAPTLYGWLATLGTNVRIEQPQSLKEAYRTYLQGIIEQY